MKPITAIVLGAGQRGANVYAAYALSFPNELKIVGVAEPRADRRAAFAKEHGIPEGRCFAGWEDALRQDKFAGCVFVCTQDRMHFEPVMQALEKGYDVLCEKPMSYDRTELITMGEKARQTGRVLSICHVLRYSPFFVKLKELIDSGAIGQLVSIQHIESVGYWHMAHSFVRGNWSRSEDSCPMILAKCCHDMDIYTWLLGKKCKAVSSVGDTHLFKKECAPEGATPYCLGGCKAKENCKFDAEKIYITNPATGIRNGNTWMAGVACGVNPTEERTYEALKNGQYGRCVYMCDNNVVDHQQTNLLFEDGTTMSFTMCAFTEKCYRYFKAMGTNGEIEADMLSNKIHVRVFGEPEEIIDVKLLANDLKGHGGGDSGIVNDFLDMLINETEATERTTTLEHSLESHFMALAAEESRLRGGELINMDAFKNGK